jgi:hypothetical protein
MPRIPSTSAASSSRCSHDSEHFPYCYVNLNYCMNALCRQEDIAMAINLTNNDRTAFTKIVFLNSGCLLVHILRDMSQSEEDMSQR